MSNPNDQDVDGLAPTAGTHPTTLNLREKATWTRQEAFLLAYSECGSIRKAAPAAGIDRTTVWWWQGRDTLGFHDRFRAAHHQFREMLQDLAIERVQQPGLSPLLLITLLNAHWLGKYRPNVQPTDDTARQVLSELRKAARRDRDGVPKVIDESGQVVEGSETNR